MNNKSKYSMNSFSAALCPSPQETVDFQCIRFQVSQRSPIAFHRLGRHRIDLEQAQSKHLCHHPLVSILLVATGCDLLAPHGFLTSRCTVEILFPLVRCQCLVNFCSAQNQFTAQYARENLKHQSHQNVHGCLDTDRQNCTSSNRCVTTYLPLPPVTVNHMVLTSDPEVDQQQVTRQRDSRPHSSRLQKPQIRCPDFSQYDCVGSPRKPSILSVLRATFSLFQSRTRPEWAWSGHARDVDRATLFWIRSVISDRAHLLGPSAILSA